MKKVLTMKNCCFLSPSVSFGVKTVLRLFLLAFVSPLFFACTMDSYDKGEGDFSLLTAEMVMAHVNADKLMDYVVTDSDERLAIDAPAEVKWAQKGDTAYRAVLYYKKLSDGRAATVSMNRVGVVRPVPRDSMEGGMKTDPIHLESMWMSRNCKFLNMRLRLMTGATDDEEAVQSMGLACDSLPLDAGHARLELYHDQGGQPEYYSASSLLSVPVEDIPADSVTITVNTYGGVVTRSFRLK